MHNDNEIQSARPAHTRTKADQALASFIAGFLAADPDDIDNMETQIMAAISEYRVHQAEAAAGMWDADSAAS